MKLFRIRSTLLIVVAGLMAGDLFADWPATGSLRDVIYAAGRFVAVGRAGTVVSSTDGETWQRATVPSTNQLVAVVHTGSKFAALSDTGEFLTSVDSLDWQSVGQIEPVVLAADLAYGRGEFVVVDDFGGIYASPDGVTWTLVFEPAEDALEELHGVTFGNNRFVAVGVRVNDDGDSLSLIRLSDSGLDWNQSRTRINEELYGVRFLEGSFQAVGQRFDADFNSYALLKSSSDGRTWTNLKVPGDERLYDIVVGNGTYVLVGDQGRITVGADPTWSKRWNGEADAAIRSVAFSGQLFVAVGDSGMAAESRDGLAWRGPNPTPRDNLTTIAKGLEFVVGGQAGTLWVSSDFASWSNTWYDSYTEIFGVARGPAGFVAVGQTVDEDANGYGVILRSLDGHSWFEVRRKLGEALQGVEYADGKFFALGYREQRLDTFDVILVSADGVTWNAASVDTGDVAWGLNGLQFGAGHFVAVGDFGTIVQSADALVWKAVAADTFADLKAVTAWPSGFVAVGDAGAVATSADGNHWEIGHLGSDHDLTALGSGDDRLVTAGAKGFLAESTDGKIWRPLVSGVTETLRDLLVIGPEVWVVGDQSTLLHLNFSVPLSVRLTMLNSPGDGQPLSLWIEGSPGMTCRVEVNSALNAPTRWLPVQTVSLNPEGTASVPIGVTEELRFYRALAD